MGQELCKVHLDLDTQSATTSSITLPDDIKDDVSYFFPLKTSFDLQELNNQKQQQISNFQLEYVKQIQKNLFSLTKPIQWEQINTKINEKFIDNILTYLYDQCKKITDEQTNYLSYQQQLQTFLTNKTINSLSNESQLSYFAIRSLVSILLILIKSVEKNDPLIIQEILSLTNQLCEELPMKSLSSSNKFLFKSLEPLTNYIQNLSSSTDPMISKQTIEIRLNFSMIKGSFKDVLPLLKNLIFNTTDIYNIQNLIIHMNDYLEKNNNDEKRTELPSFNYLKSINSYPNSELSQLPDELFTGQLISSIILSHIDIDNQLNSSTQPPDLSSLSYEFHPNTFKDLFYIIKNLSPSDKTTNHILTICLRLFRNHLKILSDVKPNLSDLAKYADENELKTWFDLLLKLSSNEIIIQEASKSLIYVINLQSASLKQRLSTLTQYLIDNKYSVLIDEILAELNKYNLLSDWIDSLCSEENKNFESLYSLIDLYFTRNDDKQKLQIQNLLFSFQYILLSRLDLQNETKTFTDNHRQLSSLVIQYLTYILKKYVHQTIEINDLFNSILLGLCLMTDTKKCFHYEFIQPIFLSILPLLTEYYLKNSDNKYLLCLVGKISQTLIIGLPQDPLEIKYTNQLKLPVLAGGYINLKQDDLFNSNLALFTKYQPVDNLEEDKDFLMSLYNNRDDGARLLTKLKTFSKTKQHLLQKSVAELVNDAIPTIFAVYVKHYRRISLAKSELLRTDETKPYDELLSLFEYATRIQSIFSTVKGQGGDCDELSKQIKQRTLFLLCSVKASDLIPIVKQETSSISIDVQSKKDSNYQRQHSNWTKAKHTIKLLRHLLQACKRFKKFMLAKKRINQQIYDYDTLVHHSIENFLYGNFYKLLSTSLTNDDDDKQFDIDQLEKCLYRQYQRAMVRLLTYRFNQIFIENLVKLNNNEQILSIYLPYLRSNDSDWSYFNHMETSNIQLKSEISYTYYSITKQILSMPNLTQNIFYLLNFSYESIDLSNLYSQQIPESLFKNYISSMKNNSTDLKFIIFNWFQLFLFKLCENIEMDLLRNTSNEMLEQHEKSIFNNLLLNEIKVDTFVEQNKHSLENLTMNWVKQSNESSELNLDKSLVLLLRSTHFYKHILSQCANIDYLQQLLHIYYNTQSSITQLLSIRFLRYLIPSISNDKEGISKNLIEKFLSDIANSIGEQNLSKEILSELIFLYRTIISMESPWQIFAKEFVLNSIKSHLNLQSIENNHLNPINQLLASLSILGGFIETIRLGSLVKIQTNDDFELALVTEINQKDRLYTIQHLGTNQIQSVTMDKLQLEIDVLPPNLLESNEIILDLLGNFLQIDSSNSNSLLFFELQRRSVSVLLYLLNDKESIELFMSKPYASILAKLSKTNLSPSDLRVFNKQHLEQYFLSLTKYPLIENKNSSQSILINKENNVPNWNKKKINANPLVLQSLSTSMNGWRPYVSEDEIQIFKQGIKGNEEISIVSHQKDVSKPEAIQQCGNKHKYNGRIVPNNENTSHTFPTYIIDNLQLSEGKWYYCVRLPYAGRAQIGWGANYFSTSSEQGVGNDSYSWGYDGSRSVLCYYNTKYRDPFDGEITWKENDIIGCGIDINNVNTNIKYWLNGQFLGTAFEHMKVIRNSDMTCNLSPNGSETSYYPAISLNFKNTPKIAAELILSPEDMDGCPLPHGYKPLLLPKVIPIENTIVEYPSHAYLIGENSQEEFLIQKQTKSTKNILRDFVNDKHLETSFNIENNSLNLPANSDGLSLSLANADTSSVTISFDYQILSDNDNKSEFILAKFDSIEIPWKKPNQTQQCIVLVLSKNGPIKVYTNNQCQTYDHKFQNAKIHLLPGIASQIKNLALWNYSLDEEQLSRLFTYGLCYISNDYQQMKEYRKRVNKITFTKNQQQFEKEYLLPFNQPFTETLWEQKKKQIDEDESKYFKSHDDEDYSTIDLYGSKTYLVLNKSNEIWTNYTFILEILIPQWPLENEKLTLLTLNSNIELYIAYDGQLCLDMDNSKKTSDIPIYLNEYLRLFVISDNQTLHVYVNDELRLNIENPQNRFQITTNHIDLFKQTQNSTNDDTLLLSLKSFSYLNRSIPVEEVLSTTSTAPPFEIIAPSLIAMGYKKHWIEPLLNGNQLKAIATSLHEQKEQLIKSDFDNQVQEYLKRLRKVNSAINADTIKDFMDYSKFHTNEQLMDTVQRVYTYLLSSQSSSELNQVKLESDESWFSQKVEDLSIPLVVTDWLESIKPNPQDSNNNQLFDMEAVIKKKKAESTEYSHDNLSSQQLYQSRLYCEQGLITIYAREIIRNMFKIWTTYDETILFPLEKFNDYSILKLLDIIKLDQISLIIKPILQNECQLNQTKPLFDYLQKDAMTELIEIFLKPSRFKQLNTKFILNVLNNFLELFKHNPNSIDSIFSVSLIRLLFNLFLFIPSFDIKVSILYLFNNILRNNEQYSLPNDIQSFFVNLLVQIVKYSDATRKKFQLALTDLVYLVLKKDHDQLKQYQAKLPSNILNLYLLADIITIWISPDKEKILPEKFFQESKFIVETSYTLNQNNYQKTNEYFSINSDKELMNYLNQCLVNDQSFPHILEGMSKESQPDPIFYKNYILLSNIPADCVEIRAKFIYLLSSFVGNLISLLDLSLQPEQSFLTDQIRRIKLYLLSSAKLQLFNTSLDDTRSYEYGSVSVNFDTVTASTDINKPEYTMFYQAYQQLHSTAHELFRRADDQLWQAQYIGMHSTDAGGPYRDSITRIGSDICSTRLPLFILCPNGRTNSGLNRDCWIPNIFPPNKSIPLKYQKQYRFVGQLIGMAIRKKHYLNIKFPNFLWKRLLNEEITIEDIESIDIQSFTMINELEKNIEQIHSFDNNEQDIDSVFSSVMGELHFDVVSSSEQVYELVPGGKDISITPKNFKHYCSLYRQYRLNEFDRQITLIQQGLYSIVPAYALNLFTSNELEESVCGKDRIDIEILKRNTEYGDSYNQTSPVIERFWTVMNDMFTDEQKKLFLIFVWGRSTLPTRDEDFRQKLKINPFLVYEGENVDRTLPRSHTCFFTLDLPAYSTTDIMYERLNYALATCSSIDGDGTMRDEANFVPHDSDDD